MSVADRDLPIALLAENIISEGHHLSLLKNGTNWPWRMNSEIEQTTKTEIPRTSG